MSVQALTRAMATSEASGIARLVLIVMANRAGGDDDLCFASTERIAHEARVHTRTVQRSIASLVESGDLISEGVHPDYRTNIYRVMPGVAQSHPPGASGPILPPNTKKQATELGRVDETLVGTNLAPRKHDWLFEVVAEVCGIDWQHDLTKAARSSLNKAVAELRPVVPDPDEVRARAANWPYDVPLTPHGLSKQWPALVKAHAGKPRRSNTVGTALAMAEQMRGAE
jgi:hypothetical protein